MNRLHLALMAWLQQHPTLGTMLASPAAVFHQYAPSGQAERYIVVHRLPAPPQRHLAGRSAQQGAGYQLEAWAATGAGALELGQALLEALECFRGYFGTVWVDACYVLDTRPLTEERQDGGQDGRRCCVQLDLELWYNL